MKVYYLQNENGETRPADLDDNKVEWLNAHPDFSLEKEREEYNLVNGYNGGLFFYEYTQTDEYKAKAAAFADQVEIETLRQRREAECFSVINRGALWFNRLTEEQKAELDTWYQEWLDVTETRTVPDKPSWL